MAEIKESQLVDSVGSAVISPGSRLPELLARRADLAHRLARLDAEIARIVADGAESPRAPSGQRDDLFFAIRGDELARGADRAPSGVDRADLQRRLSALRRTGILRSAHDPALEVLIGYRGKDGSISSIRTRRSGESAWVRRFAIRPG